ncbi:MAG: nucleoside-diphosphate kinase [Mesoaciditoga sp.]|uniref:nucleoside-diphosphate kinase n=1 Tax=Athalassotoga sp. TaxID=2022597 RepID=UPI000CB76F4B|nr:MAG: nucleoside-diphosphate kinase [Mesoaciditoga sp.]HEU24449.1 nucleoside-diphosphate kinase [Mesoaciditoga lauensis]
MMLERTLVLIKPDGVERGLIGEIVSRFEKKGFKIVEMKMFKMDKKLAEAHYEEHKGRPYYEKLINYITSGKIVAMVLEGDNAVEIVRMMIGKTSPLEALPGTIRGDLALNVTVNLVHASDSQENAKREIDRFFPSKGE